MPAKVVIVLLLALLAGCGGSSAAEPPSKPPSEADALVDLADIGQLRTEFNERQGVPRLILLLSPT